MIETPQCEICKDVPPYEKCAGDGCAKMHIAPLRITLRGKSLQQCERGDAVNLARNVIDDLPMPPKVTQKGLLLLCDAVLRMDKYIRELK